MSLKRDILKICHQMIEDVKLLYINELKIENNKKVIKREIIEL